MNLVEEADDFRERSEAGSLDRTFGLSQEIAHFSQNVRCGNSRLSLCQQLSQPVEIFGRVSTGVLVLRDVKRFVGTHDEDQHEIRVHQDGPWMEAQGARLP